VSWSVPLTPPPPDVDYYAVAFAPESDVVLLGGQNGVVRKSYDGGQNWSSVIGQIPGNETIHAISFADGSNAYAVGTNQAAFFTPNGGNTWTTVSLIGGVPGETFYGVATWGDGTPAIAVGTDGLVYAKSGARFVKQDLGAMAVTTDLTDVEAFNSGANVRICGVQGVMLFRDNGTWSQPKSQTNEDHTALSFLSADEGWGIGRPFLVTKYE
jgi:photosystem II stability/assembly factor-like uncharacterized protein